MKFSARTGHHLGTRLLVGSVVAVVLFASEAEAQRSSQWQYQPSTPTISPYLDLLQTNFGPVPNYFSMVRPRLRQESINRQIQANERSRSLRIQALEDGSQAENPLSRTGKAGGFLEYLHYYPPPRTRPRVR